MDVEHRHQEVSRAMPPIRLPRIQVHHTRDGEQSSRTTEEQVVKWNTMAVDHDIH